MLRIKSKTITLIIINLLSFLFYGNCLKINYSHCEPLISKVKDFFKTLDREILAKTESEGYYPTWESLGKTYWGHYWISGNYLYNEDYYTTECTGSKTEPKLTMKMAFSAVLYTKFEISQSTLFRRRSYIGQGINDKENSFVTMELTKKVDQVTNKEKYNATFSIDYVSAEIEDCLQERLIPVIEKWEACDYATQIRMSLFFKFHTDEENMKNMTLERYQKAWSLFNGNEAPALSKVSFLRRSDF